MKTLAEIKDEVARSHGYKDWEHAIGSNSIFENNPLYSEDVLQWADEAADLYARQAWKEAARLQRESCAANCWKQQSEFGMALKSEILNTPEPEFKV